MVKMITLQLYVKLITLLDVKPITLLDVKLITLLDVQYCLAGKF